MASEGSAGKRKGSGLFSAFLGGSDKSEKKEHDEPSNTVHSDVSGSGKEKEKSGLKKLVKKSSIFSLRTHYDDTLANQAQDRSTSSLSPLDNTDRLSPSNHYSGTKTLNKVRPASILGSLTNRHVSGGSTSTVEEEIDDSNGGHSFPSSPNLDDAGTVSTALCAPSMKPKIVHIHGEVQTTSGLFRKKKEYLVLTDTHLLRFKSQSKAADAYPAIRASHSRSGTMRQSSTSSIGSIQDLQSLKSSTNGEGYESCILLRHVIATYRNDQESKNIFCAEIVHLDEELNTLGSLQITLGTRDETDLWHSSVRAASQKARLMDPQTYPQRVVDYLARIVEAVDDYDDQSFNIFRVVKRHAGKGGKSSSDDLKGLASSVHYMVVGINQVHLISLPDFNELSQATMDAKASIQSFGLVTLVGIVVPDGDDKLELSFRLPLYPKVVLELAAASAHEIVILIHRTIIYLKPQWLEYTYLFCGPPQLMLNEAPDISDDTGWFDRTLIAYCSAYSCDPARIRYWVEQDDSADSPEFILLTPSRGNSSYTTSELLAVFRALRYNEMFSSISFAGVSLQALFGVMDNHGKEHVATSSRSSLHTRTSSRSLAEPKGRSLLFHETRALALKAARLRKLNFSGTLPRKRLKDTFDEDGDHIEKDPGCDYPAAIFPLARPQWTNVDHIIFNGIELAETDLDEIARAFESQKVEWRGLEVSRCGLTDHGLNLLLSILERQTGLQRLDISDNPGTIPLIEFSTFTTRFTNLRSINLSRAIFARGETSLLDPDTLCSWQLEELMLDGITLNENTINAIIAYVATNESRNLRLLQLEQCNLTGHHVAALMRSMCRGIESGTGRPLSLNVSNNRLEQGNGDIVMAIEENCAPHQLNMRMVNYNTESRFRQLLQALRVNTSIRTLDISKASLPKDADEETCLALRSLFEDNSTLMELDISGEQAHLETTRFGIGLSSALTGLVSNDALKTLKIEYQSLGMEGANTLASVMKENKGLRSICCENNGMTQQGFRVLVEALAENYTLTFLPEMKNDQAENIKDILKKLSTPTGSSYTNIKTEHTSNSSTMQGVRGALQKVGISKSNKDGRLDTPQNQLEIRRTLGEAWRVEIDRMRSFIARNHDIAQGLTTPEEWWRNNATKVQPTPSVSEADVLQSVVNDTTPRFERANPIDESVVVTRRLEDICEGNVQEPLIGSAQTVPEIVVGSYDSATDHAANGPIDNATDSPIDSPIGSPTDSPTDSATDIADMAAAGRAYESSVRNDKHTDDDVDLTNMDPTAINSFHH